jgi:hypothetical protein
MNDRQLPLHACGAGVIRGAMDRFCGLVGQPFGGRVDIFAGVGQQGVQTMPRNTATVCDWIFAGMGLSVCWKSAGTIPRLRLNSEQ